MVHAVKLWAGEWLVTMENVNAAQVAVKSLNLAGCEACHVKKNEDTTLATDGRKAANVVEIGMEELNKAPVTAKKPELTTNKRCGCCFV